MEGLFELAHNGQVCRPQFSGFVTRLSFFAFDVTKRCSAEHVCPK